MAAPDAQARYMNSPRLFRLLVLASLIAHQLIGLPSSGQTTDTRQAPFQQWDQNNDGFLSPSEFPSRFSKAMFDRIDKNQDGKLSREEDDAYRAKNRGGTKERKADAKLPASKSSIGSPLSGSLDLK